MGIDRRRLLTGFAAGMAAGAVLPLRAGTTTEPARTLPQRPLMSADGAVDWEAVRAEFRLAPDWIHLGSFFLVSHPRPVREAIERWRQRLDENPLLVEQLLFEPSGDNPLVRVKAALAGYLGGRPEEIALTPNTTTGLALVYNGLRVAPGQEFLTTEHDHYVHHEAIRRAAEKSGVGVRFVALHDGAAAAGADEIVARLRRAIRPATRAIGVTWVHSSTGLKLPVAALAEAVAAANAGRAEADRCLLVVDGVHGLGVEDVAAARLGADFFVAGTHKWIFAPRGTGLVWGRAEAWPHLRPTVPSFDISDDLWRAWTERQPLPATRASFVAPGGFVAYEHQFAVAEALEFHHAIGRGRVAARIRELNGRFREELARMAGVRLHTPADDRLAAGIVCFEVAGRTPAEIVARLAERRIHATTSPYKISYARVAAGIMVRPAEVETTLTAIRALARA
jgi:selenocysteine lyase/cysteine desulfurase